MLSDAARAMPPCSHAVSPQGEAQNERLMPNQTKAIGLAAALVTARMVGAMADGVSGAAGRATAGVPAAAAPATCPTQVPPHHACG